MYDLGKVGDERGVRCGARVYHCGEVIIFGIKDRVLTTYH